MYGTSFYTSILEFSQNLGEIQISEVVIDLLDTMEQALHLALNNEPLDAGKLEFACEKSEKRKETVKRLMNLITECGYFIQKYAKDVNFRTYISLFHHVLC